MGVGDYRHAPVALLPEKRPLTYSTGGGVSPSLEGSGKISPPTRIRCPNIPVCNESLQRPSYPGTHNEVLLWQISKNITLYQFLLNLLPYALLCTLRSVLSLLSKGLNSKQISVMLKKLYKSENTFGKHVLSLIDNGLEIPSLIIKEYERTDTLFHDQNFWFDSE